MKTIKINGKEYKLVYPPWADVRMSAYNKTLANLAEAESVDEEKAHEEIKEKTKKVLEICYSPLPSLDDWDLAMVELLRYIAETWGKIAPQADLFRQNKIREDSSGTEPSIRDSSP